MKRCNLTLLLLLGMVLSMNVIAETTYKLEAVTSVAAGNKYVFVQDGRAAIGSVSSNALQTTDAYKTSELTGTESYVWYLEAAVGGFYLKNMENSWYLTNTSSTNITLELASSVWTFTFTDGVALIQTSNSNRFLGYTGETTYVYKAYTNSKDMKNACPHAISVYQLVDESATPMLQVSPETIDFGTIYQNAVVGAKEVAIRFANIPSDDVTATLSGNVFRIDKTDSFLSEDKITITPTTATIGDYAETLTLSAAGVESKEVTIRMKVAALPATKKYYKVTNFNTVKDGDVVVLVREMNDSYGAALRDSPTAIAAKRCSASGAALVDNVLYAGDAYELTLTKEGDYWTMTGKDGIIGVTGDKQMTIGRTGENICTTWSIKPVSSGEMVEITSTMLEWGMIKYNSADKYFLNNASYWEPIQLYRSNAEKTIAKEVSDFSIPDHADVTIAEGGNLKISYGDRKLDSVCMNEGGKITIESNKTLTIQNMVIRSTMAGGKSGQVVGINENNFSISGDAYYEVTLGKGGTNRQYHAFSVPFPVDAVDGIYDSNGTKLTIDYNYFIMDYHGDVRAQGQYGWKKFYGTLQPGVFYMMATDGHRTTYRMKMATTFSKADNELAVHAYAPTGGQATDAGWNGTGNSQLEYVSVGADVQVLNPETYTFEVKPAGSTHFIVGTPFFYQASAEGSLVLVSANVDNNYAPRRMGTEEVKDVAITLSNDQYTDYLYLSATDEAMNEYQVGRDLVKMVLNDKPTVPQLFANAYDTKLCMMDIPMTNSGATYPLLFYAPKMGEYRLSATSVEGYDVVLTKDGNAIWNLSMGSATIDLQQGDNKGYGIVIRKSQNAATTIDGINAVDADIQKFIYDSQLYINHSGHTYDAQGRVVK